MSDSLFDGRQVRRAFSRSAASYDASAALQHAVEARLLESLDYLDERAPPHRVLDLGCGTGRASALIQLRWPRAQVLSLDVALPMLHQARLASRLWPHSPAGWLSNPFVQRPRQVCADARALPLTDGSIDVLFSNLCLQWVDDLDAVFAGFRRVLRPGGLLLVSTFGPQTLWELRDAFSHADAAPHVSPFADIAVLGDALMRAGFRQPVLDRDLDTTRYPDLAALMRGLRAIGATNALASRRHTLTGRTRFEAAARAYDTLRGSDGLLPASWETISAMAWAPDAGVPIREGGVELASIPVSRIPIRRR